MITEEGEEKEKVSLFVAIHKLPFFLQFTFSLIKNQNLKEIKKKNAEK